MMATPLTITTTTNSSSRRRGGGGGAAEAAEGLFLHEFQQSILVHHPTINLHKIWSENDIELNE
jgi:hypothetical protein